MYLLEKSRVVNQDFGERNYHIFYQYLAQASPEERKELRLKPASMYSILTKGSTISVEGVDDKAEWKKVTALQLLFLKSD